MIFNRFLYDFHFFNHLRENMTISMTKQLICRTEFQRRRISLAILACLSRGSFSPTVKIHTFVRFNNL